MWFWLGSTAVAAQLTVGPGGYASIQAAVDAADDGDEVVVQPGTWSGPVTITKDLTVAGTGATLSGRNSTLLSITGANVTVVGLTILPSGGRGVRIEGGEVDLLEVTVRGNNTRDPAYDGAGISVLGGATVTLRETTLEDNIAESRLVPFRANGWGGHLLIANSTVTVASSTLTRGEARRGGGIHVEGDSDLTLRDVTIVGGEAFEAGGALWIGEGVEVDGEGVEVRDSRSADGAAVRWASTSGVGHLTLRDSRFSGNVATGSGGALSVAGGGTLTLEAVSFSGERAATGGALRIARLDTASLTGTSFCDTRATRGGGALQIDDVGLVRVVRSVFIGTRAGSDGGGAVACSGGTVELEHVDVLDSQATGSGGGVRASDCTLRADSSLFAWTSQGAAIHAGAGAVLDHVALFGNAADVQGGAALGTGAVQGDPLLPRYRRDGVCGNDDLRTLPGSPLVDAGNPARTDPDGSRADIGVFGGEGLEADLGRDRDGDGIVGLYDCNDQDLQIRPGAVEICDGKDNDCDGVVDGPLPQAAPVWFTDADGDDFGVDGTELSACAAPPGTAPRGGDCDDADAAINPLVDEVCNDLDDDCDGNIDGAGAQGQLLWYPDADRDGFGDNTTSLASCDLPQPGWILVPRDCDDADATINPDADEACDEADRDCDGDPYGPDPVDGLAWYPDADGDGWGSEAGTAVTACLRPEGYSPGGDCDDADVAVRPLAPESCEGPDTNCDGFTGRTDNDRDGFVACEDCDDGDDGTYPNAPETWYDGVVRDCTSLSDFDQDRDGQDALEHGGTDCNDTDPSTYLDAEDPPDDDIDQDCDGEDEVRRGFCTGCDGGSGGSALLALGVVLGLRRRRDGRAPAQGC